MKELIFIWVLYLPNGGNHSFDTFKACNDFRIDMKTTYSMNVPRCHKEIYNTDSWLMPQSWYGGSIEYKQQWKSSVGSSEVTP